MVLHFGYGAPVARATRDIDYGIQLDSWESFYKVKQELLTRNFQETRVEHALLSPNGMPIDIIPFGRIEHGNREIAWPPENNPVMNTRGFEEANANAQRVIVNRSPDVECRVVSPLGLAILKFIAWMDRPRERRGGDANDIRYLLSVYLTVKNVREKIYNNENVPFTEHYNWDPDLAACHLLGKECRSIALPETIAEIHALFTSDDMLSQLVNDMAHGSAEFNHQLLVAFADGLLVKPSLKDPHHNSLSSVRNDDKP